MGALITVTTESTGGDLARVLTELATQEQSACQQFKLRGVLCLRPLTPGSPAKCISAC